MRLVLWGALGLFMANNGSLMAQEEKVPYLDPVVVTASRIPQPLSKVAQSFSIISREEIEASPADNIPDLLEYVSGVDIRQRGGHGVQADVGIRGSSFEQTLILVDGVSVSDPQTGHHNMDLPVNLEDIERIEVLKGPAARTYGPNAMAGVINVITREVDQSAVGGYVKYGDYDYYDLGAHGSLKSGDVSNRVSVSRRSSTGHIAEEETDFDIKTLTYNGAMNLGNHKFRLGLGYTDKDFGAYRFYSDEFPNQREQTESLLAYGSAHLKRADLEIMPKIFWRRHDDHFKIEIGGNWYHNEHRSNVLGVQLNSRLKSELGITAVGGEMAFEDLQSSNLGDHNRQRSGLFFEHKFYPVEWLIFGLGASAMYYSDWGWEYWPGAEFNVEFRDGFNLFGSLARSFRIPTYTELYYYTPANQGNPDLKPERAWTYEIGVRWQKPGLGANFSLFFRDEKDVIDWSRASNQDPWKARNIAEGRTQGFELGLDFYPDAFFNTPLVSTVNIAYTYLDSDRDTGGMDSKYVLDHLRHQLHGSLILAWLDGLKYVLKARYEERMVGDSHVVVDTRLAYNWRQYEVFLEATNLFDEQYVDAGFAPMPGRWIIGGVRFNMEFK
ncbi:MAG: TonB-dependent receptor [Deltaproteobacteria bacterium]|nr:MAG: TonB-dependent receptor [Deltaproteobacteria bacterium]